MMKLVLIGLLAGFVASSPAAAQDLEWKRLKIGNGGLVNRIDIAPDGTMVSGTDSYGCYIWSTARDEWVQLLTTTATPMITVDTVGGCNEIKIDPSNSSNIWMQINGTVYKSTDKARTFAVSMASPSINVDQGPAYFGPYIGIDPHNSDVVYASTTSRGLYFTRDGGAHWASNATFSAGLPRNLPSFPAITNKAGTGATFNTVGTGTRTFSNLSFNPQSVSYNAGRDNFVQVFQTSNPFNQMLGYLTRVTSTSFTINVTHAQGEGAHDDWTIGQVNDIGGGHRIAFDTSGGTVTVDGQVRTRNVFVHTYGVGTWKSIDGGVTWTPLNTAGAPKTIKRMTVDPFGVLWILDDDSIYSSTNLGKYAGTPGAGGAWTTLIPLGTSGVTIFSSLAVDRPRCTVQAKCPIAVMAGDKAIVALSSDGGKSWNLSGGSGNKSYVSRGDVDWVAELFKKTPDYFFANTDAAFDPLHPGRLYTGAEGVWWLEPPASGRKITLTQQSRGIEEFIAIQIISPASPGGTVMVGLWDFPMFYSDKFDTYPAAISGAAGAGQTSLLRGYSMDWAWNSPTTIASIVQSGDGRSPVAADKEWSGLSIKGGLPGSWNKFVSPGSTANGGCIAMSDSKILLWVPAASAGVPRMTMDGGQSWNPIVLPGGTPTASWGPMASGLPASRSCESDKGNGDLYLYNINDMTGGDRLYKWTRSTGNWSIQQRPGFAAANINEQMKAVPGKPGNVFFTPGRDQGPHPQNKPFYFSTDGWLTKNTVKGFKEVTSFGFGATFDGLSYPALYAAGWFSGTAMIDGNSARVWDSYGVWMCKEFHPSTGGCNTGWTRLGEPYPTGVIASVIDMDGDKVTPGQVYVLTHAGAFWGRF